MSNNNLSIEQNNFGELLRNTRKERKITLEELGKLTTISYGYIGQIERGTKQPEPLVREKLEAWIKNPKFEVTAVYESMTTEEKLKQIGLPARQIRLLLEMEKLPEEEQNNRLKELINENIDKGRF